MGLCLWRGFLSVLLLSSAVSGTPRIVSEEQEIRASVDDTVVFQCEVEDTDSDTHLIQWWLLDQNVQLSNNDAILVKDDRFAIIRPEGGLGLMKHLQIASVRASDAGLYQCKVGNSRRTHTLTIVDAPVVPGPGTIQPSNFTDCCVAHDVSAACLPVCSPSTVDMNTFDVTSCAADLASLIACGSDERNHIPCCHKRSVPNTCLPFCNNGVYDSSDPIVGICLFSALSIIECYEEGNHVLPSPPTHFHVEALSASEIRASWQPPTENIESSASYRLFYRRASDIHALKTAVLPNRFEYTLNGLEANTLYSLYVIAINTYGSSQPSYRLQVQTHARTPLPPGLDQESFQQCCIHRGVSEACRPILCGDGPVDSGVSMSDCFTHVDKVFQCMSGERNHTACCQKQQIDSRCYALCGGQITSLQPDQFHCIQLLPQISSCFSEGIANLPGPPRGLEIKDVDTRSVILTWSAPTDRADLVVAYTARYWPSFSPLEAKQEVVQYPVNMITLVNLQPGTRYTAEVISIGTNGTSIATPTALFITEDVSAEPNPTTPTTIPEAHNETACCIDKGVTLSCMDLCDYSVDYSTQSTQHALECATHIPDILVCGSGNRNHSNCCQERFVPAGCLPLCMLSDEGAKSDQLLPIFTCSSYLNLITSCMADGVVLAPSPPVAIQVSSETPQSLTVTWQEPVSRPVGIDLTYELSWQQSGSNTTNMIPVDTRTKTIHNLSPDTEYTIQVVALTDQGRSLPGTRLLARTPPESNPVLVPVTTDLTSCCQDKGVQPACMAVCSGTTTVDHNTCSADLLKVTECAADGRDHRQCCRRSNLPFQCLGYCEGRPRAESFLQVLCLSFLPQIFSCFREGYPKLPSQPTDFYILDVNATSAVLFWSAPEKNAFGVQYDLYYMPVYNVSETHVVMNVTSPYVLGGLKPVFPYTVYIVATNAWGSSLPTNKVQFVTVAVEAPVIITYPVLPRRVLDGSTVTLSCVASGQPVPTIRWLHNTEVTHNATLVLSAVRADDTGRYTCVAENSVGRVARSVYVNVQHALTVKAADRVVAVAAGRFLTAQLRCDVTGFPDTISWTKDYLNISLEGSNRYLTRYEILQTSGMTRAHFDIPSVTEADYGVYTCLANNTYGQDHADIQLVDPSVLPPPDQAPLKINISVHDCCVGHGVRQKCLPVCSFDVTLEFLAGLSPGDQTECLSDGDKILGCAADGRDHTQCCAQRKIPDQCLPFCLGIVQQPLPSNQSVCLLYMEEIVDCMEQGHETLPSAPRNLRGRLVNGFIEVWWDEPATNADKVQFYDLVYHRQGDPEPANISVDPFTRVFNLSGVHSFTTYMITVEARNHYGTSHLSNSINVPTFELFPSRPYNVRGSYIGWGEMNLHWTQPQDHSGAVLYYAVYYAVRHVHPQYQRVNTTNAALHYILKGLRGNTNYSVYVTAVSSHYESKPSQIFFFATGENDMSLPSPHESNTSPVVPVVSVLIIVGIVVGLGVFLYWYFRVRREPHQRFKDSVSFENLGYAPRDGDETAEPRAWITESPPAVAMTPAGAGREKQSSADPSDGAPGAGVPPDHAPGITSLMTEVPSDAAYQTLSWPETNGTDKHSYATIDVSNNRDLADGSAIKLDLNKSHSST